MMLPLAISVELIADVASLLVLLLLLLLFQ